jgi:uncharacterized membrane protein YhhN
MRIGYDSVVITTVILASVMAGAVISLLHAIRVGDRALEVISKTAASAAFVTLGFACWSRADPDDAWLIAALMLCAAGDLFLLWRRSFDIGLFSFLLGHIAYVSRFAVALPIGEWPPLALAPLVIAGAGAAWWLWPHLGRRRPAVLAYIVIISVMVWGGISAWTGNRLPWTAAVGAILFYLSDLAVARQRFVRQSFTNRAVGLPLYYLGQLLLALTVGAR